MILEKLDPIALTLQDWVKKTQIHRLSVRRLLARIHRGDILTDTLSKTLKIIVLIGSIFFGLVWLVLWFSIYIELERWNLVLAFVDQFSRLVFIATVLYITYIRSKHLERIPPGPFVPLRAISLIARWAGECVLILAIASLFSTLLGNPLTLIDSAPPGTGSDLFLEVMAGAFKILGLGFALIFQLMGFLLFIGLYTVAGLIELSIQIEKNTRRSGLSSTQALTEGPGQGSEI